MKSIRSILLLVCIICIASQAQAENVTKPYTFTSGTTASASQVNANFDALFNAINQGSSALPAGAIIMWSGSASQIPTGWAICDGSNGTPDLRDRFIVVAGGNYTAGNTGGTNTNDLNHSHTVNNHTHHIDVTFTNCTGDCKDGADDGSKDVGSDDHGHHLIADTQGSSPGTSASLSSAVENRPPYYALNFIMKLP
jgi:microcystin-dependent protein